MCNTNSGFLFFYFFVFTSIKYREAWNIRPSFFLASVLDQLSLSIPGYASQKPSFSPLWNSCLFLSEPRFMCHRHFHATLSLHLISLFSPFAVFPYPSPNHHFPSALRHPSSFLAYGLVTLQYNPASLHVPNTIYSPLSFCPNRFPYQSHPPYHQIFPTFTHPLGFHTLASRPPCTAPPSPAEAQHSSLSHGNTDVGMQIDSRQPAASPLSCRFRRLPLRLTASTCKNGLLAWREKRRR